MNENKEKKHDASSSEDAILKSALNQLNSWCAIEMQRK